MFAPKVARPVFETSAAVRVTGLLEGAVVSLTDGSGAVGADAVADAVGAALITVPPGGLVAGRRLTAIARLGTESSPNSGQVPVLPVPSPLPEPVFVDSVHACSAFVTLRHLVPGATVTVSSGGTTQGTGVADRDRANVPIQPGQKVGSQLTAVQTLAGVTSQPGYSPPVRRGPGAAAPALVPIVAGRLSACSRAVPVRVSVPGVSIEVHRTAADGTVMPVETVDATTLLGRVLVDPPLSEGERIALAATSVQCEIFGVEGAGHLVRATAPLPAPYVTPFPLCPDQPVLRLSRLVVGAEVRVARIGDRSETLRATAGASAQSFPLPGSWLPAGGMVEVTQSLCGVTSASVFVPVFSFIDLSDPLEIGPLAPCQDVIEVRGVRSGSVVTVTDSAGTSLSDPTLGDGAVVRVRLDRGLKPGETIEVRQGGCGAAEATAKRVEAPPLRKPVIAEPVRAGDTTITVFGVVAGDTVHVTVDRDPVLVFAQARATASTVDVNVPPLPVDARVAVEVCGCGTPPASASASVRPRSATRRVGMGVPRIVCFQEGDGAGVAEPYLWLTGLILDGSTLVQDRDGDRFVGTPQFFQPGGSHGNLGTTSVDAGDTVTVPASLGRWDTVTRPIVITHSFLLQGGGSGRVEIPPLCALFGVLMEDNGAPDSAAEAGHQVLNRIVREEVAVWLDRLRITRLLLDTAHEIALVIGSGVNPTPAQAQEGLTRALRPHIDELRDAIEARRDDVRSTISDNYGPNPAGLVDPESEVGHFIWNFGLDELSSGPLQAAFDIYETPGESIGGGGGVYEGTPAHFQVQTFAELLPPN